MPSRRSTFAAAVGLHRVVAGNPGVERLAGAHRVIERGHGLLKRRLRVRPVGVKNVHVIELHPLQALVQAGQQILARAPIAVRPGPHVVAGLGADHEFVAVGAEIAVHDAPEILLGGAGRRTVIVRQVEVGDAEVEGAPEQGPAILEGVHAAEIVPKPRAKSRGEAIRCGRTAGIACCRNASSRARSS